MTYRAELSLRALSQIRGLPGRAFDSLAQATVEVVDYPDDPLRTFPTSDPYVRRVEFGSAGLAGRLVPGWRGLRRYAAAVTVELLPGPAAWMRQAACLGMAGPDHDPWHPPPEAPASVRNAFVAEAVAVCAVQVTCGRYGLELLASDYVVAVSGAMDPDALRDIARRIGRPARKVAQHGTRARYVSKTDACRCEACRAVNARGEHARREGKAAQRREWQAWAATAGKRCRDIAQPGSIFCSDHAIPDRPASALRVWVIARRTVPAGGRLGCHRVSRPTSGEPCWGRAL